MTKHTLNRVHGLLFLFTRVPLELVGYAALVILWMAWLGVACVAAVLTGVSSSLSSWFVGESHAVLSRFTTLILFHPQPLSQYWDTVDAQTLATKSAYALLWVALTAPAWMVYWAILATEDLIGIALLLMRTLFEYADHVFLGGFVSRFIVRPSFAWFASLMLRLHAGCHENTTFELFVLPLQPLVSFLMFPTSLLPLHDLKAQHDAGKHQAVFGIVETYLLHGDAYADLYAKKTVALVMRRLFFLGVVAGCVILALLHLPLVVTFLWMATLLTAAVIIDSLALSVATNLAFDWAQRVGWVSKWRRAFAEAHPVAAFILHGLPLASIALLSLVWLGPTYGIAPLSPPGIMVMIGVGVFSVLGFIFARACKQAFLARIKHGTDKDKMILDNNVLGQLIEVTNTPSNDARAVELLQHRLLITLALVANSYTVMPGTSGLRSRYGSQVPFLIYTGRSATRQPYLKVTSK